MFFLFKPPLIISIRDFQNYCPPKHNEAPVCSSNSPAGPFITGGHSNHTSSVLAPHTCSQLRQGFTVNASLERIMMMETTGSGWWFSHPSEKWWSSSIGMMTETQYFWENAKVMATSYHQPEDLCVDQTMETPMILRCHLPPVQSVWQCLRDPWHPMTPCTDHWTIATSRLPTIFTKQSDIPALPLISKGNACYCQNMSKSSIVISDRE